MRLWLRLILVLASGFLIPLCFPPYGWWPFLPVSFAALLAAIKDADLRVSFYLGMLQGGVGYGLSLYWFYNIFGIGAVTFIAILALFNAIFCLLYNWVSGRSRSAVVKVLIAAVLWTAIEFYRSELFFLRFPWITPGTGLGPTLLSPVLGVYGASFLVAAACAALVQKETLSLGLPLFAAVVFLGAVRPGPVEIAAGQEIRVLLVQSEDGFMGSYIALTRSADRAAEADLVIWPEYALPYDVRQKPADFEKLQRLCDELEAILVAGTKTNISAEKGKWHNTALTLNSRGLLGEYHKARPVHLFHDGVPGRNFKPIDTEIGTFGTPICFDCDYTRVCRKMADLGAKFFAVPSYDAQSWSKTQHLQHAMMFRLRAAENARWLACASSSGVTQVIDPHGNIHGKLPLMREGTAFCRIGTNGGKTFFTRIGWLFPWVTIAAAVILIAKKLKFGIASKRTLS